jgi:hypothetical protein
MELVVWAGFGTFFSRLKSFFRRLYDEEISGLLRDPNEPNP